MKNLLFVIAFLSIMSCKNNVQGITIDEGIISEVESNISESELIPSEGKTIYDNAVIADLYENDSLIRSSDGTNKVVFASFFYNRNDTLVIDGLYGVFQGFGFSIQISDNDTSIYHLLESRKRPAYSLMSNDALQYRLEVPCVNTKLTLSKIPDFKESEVIYGVVELESLDYYYQEAFLKGATVPERTKGKIKMKAYFKSMYMDFYGED